MMEEAYCPVCKERLVALSLKSGDGIFNKMKNAIKNEWEFEGYCRDCKRAYRIEAKR